MGLYEFVYLMEPFLLPEFFSSKLLLSVFNPMQAKHMLIPYIPMLVPPKKWKGYEAN